jgi:hypothetical protein
MGDLNGTDGAVIGGASLLGGPAGGLLAAGGVAGSKPDKSKSQYASYTDAGSATAAEQTGQNGMLDSYAKLMEMVNAGPGQQDVARSYSSSRDLASLLDDYSKGGYMPTSSDQSQAQSLAQGLFNPQRVAMQQAFQDQNTQYARQAALMGRSPTDPVLAAKLAQEQTRQSAMLDANQNSFAMQQAMNNPLQRLGFATDKNNILSGLATQAMANRQAIASMGEGIMNNERQFRLATATHYGNQQTESGGGFKGAFNGVMATAGTMASIGGMAMGMPSMGGAGGGGAPIGSSAAGTQAPMSVGGANFQQGAAYFNGGNPSARPPSYGDSHQYFAGGYQPSNSYGQPRTISLGGM